MFKVDHKRIIRIFSLTLFVITLALIVESDISSDASFAYLEGIASWYSEFSPGIKPTTASMEVFDHGGMTCAMWGLPFNTMVEVTNMNNGKKVIVRVNDRGPAKRLCGEGRVIDLTMEAFRRIDSLDRGLARVKLRVVR